MASLAKNKKIALLAAVIVVIAGVLIALHVSGAKKEQVMQAQALAALAQENAKVSAYAAATADRVDSALITLPDGNTLVTLQDGLGVYTPSYDPKEKNKGLVVLKKHLTTKFVSGILGGASPRLDAIVPMTVSLDTKGGSTYIVLFNDTGSAANEKSYARIGSDTAVSVESISILAPDSKTEDYKADIQYSLLEGTGKQKTTLEKEVIIPVISGRFDPAGTISR